MPLIPFPAVPPYPGVPPLARSGVISPTVQLSLGIVQTVLASALQSPSQWGIFNAATGARLGVNSTGNSLLASLLGATGPMLSTNAFEFTKETRISTFPVETASFAAYNKVKMPSQPTVSLALTGSASDRSIFLGQLDTACDSTTLFNVVTPEKTYHNFAFERYNLVRRAERGATLLIAEISMLQIRQVSAAFSSTPTTPINTPQNPAATPASNGGIVQPQTAPSSILNTIMTGGTS